MNPIIVSVVTPTYNRRLFIPILIEIYKSQTFPKEQTEWIILDDGRDKVEDLFIEASNTIPNIRYLYSDEKMRIGAKRNLLNKEATGTIIIAMDDDDFYPSTRITSIVDAFHTHLDISLAGSSEMYMYYTDNKQIYKVGPYHPNHATNGTMAWRKSYSNTHLYSEYVTKAEEVSFLENYKHKMIQLHPVDTILVICHTDNTVDKLKMRQENLLSSSNLMTPTHYSLQDFIKNNDILSFYNKL
jgi:glycosyltransferase involved in cell wall biosynthesis